MSSELINYRFWRWLSQREIVPSKEATFLSSHVLVAEGWPHNKGTTVCGTYLNISWMSYLSIIKYYKQNILNLSDISFLKSHKKSLIYLWAKNRIQWHKQLTVDLGLSSNMNYMHDIQHLHNLIMGQLIYLLSIIRIDYSFRFFKTLLGKKLKNMLFIGSWFDYLRIDRNFCSVHEEITSIRLYTPYNLRSSLCKGVYNLIEVISNEPNK